ncbi:MAG TPA: T9SS type A sorting domain-containing protein [Gemmatimonadales bacterium]|jgi:hypothetical protein|nr:T9SS type A sorting domain-containing protein [Gemmatimonadales bacterium]
MVRMVRPGWWLGLLVGVGSPVAAQANVSPPRVELKENYPNPFFPATTIPFTIDPEVCTGGRQPVVSLKIYNVLVQVVAVPRLGGSSERLDSLALKCGEYLAYWDGKYLDGKREATPGVYYYQLTVDGERYTRKMIAQRKVTSQQ